MKPLTIEELRELAPGFVMGTLSLEEQRAFDIAMANAATAAALEEELAAHRAAVEFLATSQAVAPPPSLKGRVMARIGTGETSRATTAAAPPVPPMPPMPQIPPRPAVPDAPVRVERAAHGPSRAGWWAGAALGTALAASLLFALDLRRETAALRQQLAQQVAELGRAQTRLAERERTLGTLLGGGADVTLVRLAPSAPQGPGMQVFWNVREGRAIVTARGLSPIARDRAYALWMIRDGTPVPLALFSPDSAGSAVVEDIDVPTELQGVAAFAVTEEPAGGSPQPTMTPFLVGAVPKP